MKVNLVGDVLPKGRLLVTLHGVPRIGEVVRLGGLDVAPRLIVTDVWWPCDTNGLGIEIHPDVMVETLS